MDEWTNEPHGKEIEVEDEKLKNCVTAFTYVIFPIYIFKTRSVSVFVITPVHRNEMIVLQVT